MNTMQDDPLGRRLATLGLTTPPDLIARVLAASPAQHRRATGRPLWATLGMAGILLVGALTAATYFAPRFQQALADSPLVGSAITPLLQGLGLEPLTGRFHEVHAVSTSAGYQMQIVGAYADENETYFAVRMTPALPTYPSDATLTDQFGRNLQLQGGTTDLVSGNAIWNFAGVGWPDTVVGARLTLHVRSLDVASDPPHVLQGNWTLHPTIAIEPGKPYAGPLPADGTLDNSSIRFTRVQASAATVQVQMQIGEPLSKRLGDTVGSVVPGVSKPHPAFDVRLLRVDGTDVQGLREEEHSSLGGTDVSVIWLRPAPGTYRLVVSYEGIGQIERPLQLP